MLFKISPDSFNVQEGLSTNGLLLKTIPVLNVFPPPLPPATCVCVFVCVCLYFALDHTLIGDIGLHTYHMTNSNLNYLFNIEGVFSCFSI